MISPRTVSPASRRDTPYCWSSLMSVRLAERIQAVCSTFRSPNGRFIRPPRTSPASSPSSHPAQNSRATTLFSSLDVTLMAEAG